MLRTAFLSVAVIVSTLAAVSYWAASGLPQVDNGFVQAICKEPHGPADTAYMGRFTYMIPDYSRVSAILNMDGTWSYSRWQLFRTMAVGSWKLPALRSPREVGWRLLLASPLVRDAGPEHAAYVANHPQSWNCKKDAL